MLFGEAYWTQEAPCDSVEAIFGEIVTRGEDEVWVVVK